MYMLFFVLALIGGLVLAVHVTLEINELSGRIAECTNRIREYYGDGKNAGVDQQGGTGS